MSKKSIIRKCVAAVLIVAASVIIFKSVQYQSLAVKDSGSHPEEKILLTVLAGQSTSDAGIEDLIDEALAEKFPQVQLEWECVDWGENFGSQMQARFASGDIPDIMIGKAQDVYVYAAMGNLAPIPSSCSDRIEEKALEPVTIDGTVYGLPYNAFYQGVIYRKDIFEKYNLEPPETQADLDSIISVLAANRITPFAAHFQESWQIANMTMQFFMNDIFSVDPDWGDRFRDRKTDFSDNNHIETCLLQNQFILTHSWPDALMLDQYESDRRFIEGEAAMYMTGTWSLQTINQYSSSQEYGIFPYPNQSGDAKLIRETNITFMKSNSSDNGDLIDQVLEELVTNEDLVQNILDFTQTSSVIKDIEPEYSSCIDEDVSWYEEKNQVVEVTAGNNQLLWIFQDDVAGKLQEWLQGKISLEDVMQYADLHRFESSN